MRLRLSFLSFLLLIALVETGLAATQVTVMEPRKYARTPGPPNRFVSTFQAAPGTGKLTVINGESDGRNRISSAVIQLNGNQVFGPRSFNQNQSEITGNVQLLERLAFCRTREWAGRIPRQGRKEPSGKPSAGQNILTRGKRLRHKRCDATRF